MLAFALAACADLAGFAGLALDEQAAFAVVNNAADYTGGDEQAGVPVGELVQRANGVRRAAAKMCLGVTPQAAICGNHRCQLVRVNVYRAQAQGVVVRRQDIACLWRCRKGWPRGFSLLPGGEGFEHLGVRLERRSTFTPDDDDLLEAVGCRLPDGEIGKASEQPALPAAVKARLRDDVDEDATGVQCREKAAEKLVFQPCRFVFTVATAQCLRIGWVQKQHIRRLRRDVRRERAAFQQRGQLRFCRRCPSFVQFNAVAFGKGIAVAVRQLRQRRAFAAAGIEEFQCLLAGGEQVDDAAHGAVIGGVVAHRRIVLCDAAVHQGFSHAAPPGGNAAF